MPTKPLTPCRAPACHQLTSDALRYCATHVAARPIERQYDAWRGSPESRGYDRAWRTLSEAHLRNHPLCIVCEWRGQVTVATEVHHIYPVATHPERRLDRTNLGSLCHSDHMTWESMIRQHGPEAAHRMMLAPQTGNP